MANNDRRKKGSHSARKRRRRRRMTSWGGRRVGVFGAYWGAKLKRVEHSSHLPAFVEMLADYPRRSQPDNASSSTATTIVKRTISSCHLQP
eukprot:scaffold2192_cov200-Alexandrium_tamarense.AAC.24